MTDKNKIYLDRVVKLLVDTTDIVPISKDIITDKNNNNER